eukprot:TRINITY_DN34868_c0_g1_i1.p1 TRINITY_DN34868_c0_g1~~TRINITY_DN34868_c0_g1_i1.p1  ORF type:complete len:269 (+),score=46.66 TRINITY_DN34868_c0_g1_i1:25-807(+)
MGTSCTPSLLLSLFALLFLSCWGSSVDAGQGTHVPTLSLESALALHAAMDKDSDGNVSLQEFVDFSVTVTQSQARNNIGIFIKALDADGDGHIDWEEMTMDLRRKHTLSSKVQDGDSLKFQTVDKDKDGRLNRTEAAAYFFPSSDCDVMHLWARRHVDALDRDEDGYLSLEELTEVRSEYTAEDFADFDTDGDGLLSADELQVDETGEWGVRQVMAKLIKLADSDASGHLSAREVENAYHELRKSEAHDYLQQWANHMNL